jgi:feruloyl-CoA synthase
VRQSGSISGLSVYSTNKTPSILSWLPWNHVFAGNSDFNMMLSNGGSLYLDDGKPVGKLFERTLENIRSRAGSLSFNVPIAHGLAMTAMKDNLELQRKYFENLDVFFYADASLPSEIWNAVEEMALAIKGKIPLMISSCGLTETAPCCMIYYQQGASSGMIGVPVPELEAELIPLGQSRYEIRVRGPNVFKEYFGDVEKTKTSFDEEGFFITGDAVRWVDPENPALGVYFDGRLTENFKLMTGTWVHATTLRISALGALQNLVQDLIIVGEGHGEIGLFIFPATGKIPEDTIIQDGCYIAHHTIKNFKQHFMQWPKALQVHPI